MTPATTMHSGSMGKLYTATAVMQLVESGVLGLHDPINKYLRDFQVINPLGEREITFYDLLTHRSGLTNNNAGSDFAVPRSLAGHLRDGYSTPTFEEYKGTWLRRWAAKVGERFQYSNFGMATLGYLVEILNQEGLSFSDYVQRHIMDPLGMASSQFPPVQDAAHVRRDLFERMSTGYANIGPVDLPTPTIYFADYPAGTVVTTPGDHLRLLLAFQRGGEYNGHRLLKPATVRLMLTPQTDAPRRGPSVKIGLVWFLVNWGTPDEWFGHGGAHMFGWANASCVYPTQDFGLVLATNHWNMMPQLTGYGRSEPFLISQFILSWIKSDRAQPHPALPPHSWAWKRSYAVGMLMAEQLQGGLGMQSPLTDDMIEAMASRAQWRPTPGGETWDADGFRSGVRDMLSVDMTRPSIRAFVESYRLQVPAEELPLLFRELGSSGDPLLPYPGDPETAEAVLDAS